MFTLQELRAFVAKKTGDARALIELAQKEKRDLTEAEDTQVNALLGEVDKHKKNIERLERLEGHETWLGGLAGAAPPANGQRDNELPLEKRITIPATAMRTRELKAFKGPDADARAYVSGMFLAATLFRRGWAADWCKSHGLDLRAHSEGVDTLGGFLVPPVMLRTIIDLREEYGVFRRESKVIPMSSDTVSIPRRTGGLTAYAIGEGDSVTESDKGWDAVNLVARKWGVRTRWSSELAEDAIISIADDLASEIAYAFAYYEDLSGFNGDGTSTYHGIHGVMARINDGNHAGSIATALAGNTYFAVLDLVDFEACLGMLPSYAEPNAKWYISRAGWAASMMRLADAAGGNTRGILETKPTQMFLGYPVVHSSVLFATLTASVSTIHALFGDLRLASTFGDRRGVSIAVSDQFHFDTDQIGIRGTERYDINVHDLGGASTAGPIIALKTPGA